VPTGTSATSGGRSSATSSRVVSYRSTCAPDARPRIRAQRMIVGPA
jgi:hypothetical protein